MPKQYLLSILLATTVVLSGCGGALPFGSSPTATPLPFALFTAQDVFDAFADLDVQNVEQAQTPGRDDPAEFRERYLFEIASIAPLGGQVITFNTPEQLGAWQAYIESLRNQSATRRSVVYVYFKNNVMVQLNSALTVQQAAEFREALDEMQFTG
jgi:hypothetical protein